jgi:DNA-binding NarL/FixJ family response regulator
MKPNADVNQASELEQLAITVYLTGHDDEACDAWARAHQAFVRDGDGSAAARSAFWLGCALLLRGQMAPGLGWLARVTSLVERGTAAPLACAYAELAAGVHGFFSGDPTSAHPHYVTAVRAGQLHDDADVAAMGLLGCGQTELMLGRPEGMARLDEAMAAVTAGDVSPVATGLIYCAVIETCSGMCDLRRAQEWTNALSDWCAAQRDLVPFRGQCLVHRAQLLRLHGSWTDALAEAREAVRRLTEPPHPALGAAVYEEAELHRLRGDMRSADRAYRRASDLGHGVASGLALLLLADGRADTAAAVIDRALAEPQFPATRARLLAARAEALLATDDVAGARGAADELATLDAELGSPPLLAAMASHADGAVLLEEGDARSAVRRLRRAWTSWHEIDAPYETARTRVLIGLACRSLGDEESASMELAAARRTFARLGATPDVARVAALLAPRRVPGGLTVREVEVLSLVAKGDTNRAIAAELMISEKTVARHLSNIFTKLGVSSRSAATAYAYEHHLTDGTVGGHG